MNHQEFLNSLEGTEVAIIGMAGRFPGAANLHELWQNIQLGVDATTQLDDETLTAAGVDSGTLHDPDYVKAAALLEGLDFFDADFFGMSAKDAAIMDPQHRLLLEAAWHALEDAGYDAEKASEPIGIFAGCGFNSYMMFNLAANKELVQEEGLFLLRHLGNDKDFLTTRISYLLNLRGPSVNVQTACSTSLVAVHLACQSLLNGECSMALAGGVTIKVPQVRGYWYREGKQHLSRTGRCRPFDVEADGMISSSGAGMIVLKLLEDAILDGDHIYAVIKGSAVNNDGSLKAGYMTPGVHGQTQVVAEALAMAGIAPSSIGFVSAHGTGTPLGDTLEVSALTQAFGGDVQGEPFCALGSVKGNIGHADTAAGIASLATAVFALHDQLLPPNANFTAPNPTMDLVNSPFYFNTSLREWRADEMPRRASVNAIGIGGTNAHVVLEEAPERAASGPSRPWQLLMLSAKTSTALQEMKDNLATHLAQNRDLDVADAAFTLQVGRQHFVHREYVICRGLEDGQTALQVIESPHRFTGKAGGKRGVVFVLSDSGLRTEDLELFYEGEPVFQEEVDRCLQQTVYKEFWDMPDEEPVTQFVWQYAMAKLLLSWGITVGALLGVGIGELVAACLADVMDLSEALKLILHYVSEHNGHSATYTLNGLQTAVAATTLVHHEEKLALRKPEMRLYNPATGDVLTAGEVMDESYWRDTIWENGRFSTTTLTKIAQDSQDLLLDFSPGADTAVCQPLFTPIASAPEDAYGALINTVGQLWLAGVPIDWRGYYQHEQRYRVSLPAYAFQRQRHWIDAPPNQQPVKQSTPWRPRFKAKPGSDSTRPSRREIIAPTNNTEKQVWQIWQDVLKVHPLSTEDRFFELGGTSQQAIQLIARINRQFNKNLPPTTLFEAPTITQLSKILADHQWENDWKYLVPIQPAGDLTPFFCVHGVGGFVLELYPLAQELGKDRPFYGVQAQGADGAPLAELSLQQMAANYLAEIRQLQPHGPYLIGGYCFGGKLAYEMAQQLQAGGEEVALLVMLHSETTQYKRLAPETRSWQRRYYALHKRMALEKSNLSVQASKKRYIRQRVQHLWNVMRVKRLKNQPAVTNRINAEHPLWTDYLIRRIGLRNTIASQAYHAEPYAGKTLFIRATEEMKGLRYQPLLGWDDLLTGHVAVIELTGHQENIIEYPCVSLLAERLNEELLNSSVDYG